MIARRGTTNWIVALGPWQPRALPASYDRRRPLRRVDSGPAPVGACADSGEYSPEIHPADFVAGVDNPYWPLEPGTTYHYRGVRGTTPQTDDEIVTHQTKRILGIPCMVVRDTVSERGRPVERTFDWYAQDRQGNVWYMGEDSLELRHGRFVTASDSWESGVDGAEPGIIMPGNPQPGDAYRQEYYPPGEALDQARVLKTDGSMNVPYGSFMGFSSRASAALSSRRPSRSTTRRAWARWRSRWSEATTSSSGWSTSLTLGG